MKKSQSQIDLEQVWRTAFGKEGGLEIECGTKSNATRFRQILYNAVKWVKAPKDGQIADELLQEAVGECVLSLAGEGQTIVHVRRKQDDPVMQAVRGLIGGPAKDSISHAAEESQARLQALLAGERAVRVEVEAPQDHPARRYLTEPAAPVDFAAIAKRLEEAKKRAQDAE